MKLDLSFKSSVIIKVPHILFFFGRARQEVTCVHLHNCIIGWIAFVTSTNIWQYGM
jgi:hypothetical protein